MTLLEQIRHLEEQLFGEELNGGKRIMSERSFWHFRPSHHSTRALATLERSLMVLALRQAQGSGHSLLSREANDPERTSNTSESKGHGKEARIQSERAFWHFRPSHHVKTGLLTAEDIALLSQPGKRLLSVGAHPAFFERLLPELGVPKANILLADKDPAIVVSAGELPSVVFDACETWPDIGMFDRIIFPESLCIALSDRLKESTKDRNEKDAREAALLTSILRQALERLRPGGIFRANGPMSHPNVIRMVKERLQRETLPVTFESERFFLSLTSPRAISE